MPSLPIAWSKIQEISKNPKATPADLNQVISLDPVLMGRVMKLINSAYYGLNNQITSLVRAIIMLGREHGEEPRPVHRRARRAFQQEQLPGAQQ